MQSGNETKRNLAAALKELMRQKGPDKITIREITEKCGCNRQTFYYHFEDIYDLLKWLYQQDIVMLQNKQKEGNSWQEEILMLLDYLTKNRSVCINTLNSMGYRNLRRFFYEDIYGIINKFILELQSCKNESEDYIEFLTHFYTISLGTLMESWVLGEIEKEPQSIVEYLCKIIK